MTRQRRVRSPADPDRVRAMVERMGPAFVKFGQFLSLRPDLIPSEYAEQFLLLTDQRAPIPFDVLRGTIEQKLGDISARFAYFDARPLAAGSLAQVHVALTSDGHEVVVKVLRPGIERALRAEIRQGHVVPRVLALVGVSTAPSRDQVEAQFDQWISDEMNLETELRNLIRMKQLCAGSDVAVVPSPCPELSSRGILTCERLRGSRFSDILCEIRAGRTDLVTRLGHDPRLLARNLIETVLTQIFRHQFFDANIHPENLLAMPGGRIGLLDIAVTGRLDPIVERGMVRYLNALADEDLVRMDRAVADVLRVTERTDLDPFRRQFTEAMRGLFRDLARASDEPERGHHLRRYMVSLIQIAHANDLTVPAGMMLLYQSLVASEAIAAALGASTDVVSEARRFLRRLQVENMLAPKPIQFQRIGLRYADLLLDAPGQLTRLVEGQTNGRFAVRTRDASATERRRQHNARAHLVTLALATVGLSLLIAGAPGPSLVRPLVVAILAIIYVALAVQWRRLR